MFSILGENKKRITQKLECLCLVDENEELISLYPLDLMGLLRQFAKLNNMELRSLNRLSTGLTLLNCMRYYYGLHATIPVSLYGAD